MALKDLAYDPNDFMEEVEVNEFLKGVEIIKDDQGMCAGRRYFRTADGFLLTQAVLAEPGNTRCIVYGVRHGGSVLTLAIQEQLEAERRERLALKAEEEKRKFEGLTGRKRRNAMKREKKKEKAKKIAEEAAADE